MRILACIVKARVSLSGDEAILNEARSLNPHLSRLPGERLAESPRAALAQRWPENNRGAIQAYDERLSEPGRRFGISDVSRH